MGKGVVLRVRGVVAGRVMCVEWQRRMSVLDGVILVALMIDWRDDEGFALRAVGSASECSSARGVVFGVQRRVFGDGAATDVCPTPPRPLEIT